MFKRFERMHSVFECRVCQQILEDPIILPCGETICKKDLELLGNHSSCMSSSPASTDSSFSFHSSSSNGARDFIRCKFCGLDHEQPEAGFPQDKRVQKMLKLQLDSLVYESLFDNCRSVLNELNLRAEEMTALERDPEFFLFEYFSEIINQVDEFREGLKLKIDAYYFDMIAEIKAAESQCKLNCKNLKEYTEDFENLKSSLNELNRKFDLLELNDRKLNQIAREAHHLKQKIVEEVKNCESFLLENKSYSFQAPETTKIEDVFGVFKPSENVKTDVYTSYINSGNNMYKQGRFEEAISFHERAIQFEPTFSDAYFYKGNALNSLEEYQKAIDCYDKAIEFDSGDHEAFTNKASSLCKLSNYKEALVCYDQALSLSPTYSLALFGKANTLNSIESFKEALLFYDELLEIEPDYSLAYFNKGVTLHKLERFEDELKCYDATVRLEPTYTDAYFYKASVLCVLGRFDEALACIDMNIELDPYSSEAYNCKGEIFSCSRQFDRALSCFSRAIQLNPGKSEFYRNKRHALASLGRSGEALSCYNLCSN